VLRGDGGADRLDGAAGNDLLSGGNDDDVLIGGLGADEIAGDEGWDTADYATRTDPLTIDLDDQRDDGARGEGDSVRTTIEAVIGGAAGDRITGHAGENYLYGEGGADRLSGAAGNDRLYGGPGNDRLSGGSEPDELDGAAGNDRLWARDSRREAVRCGPGKDRASTDSTDMLFGCEGAHAGAAARPKSRRRRVTGIRARAGGGGTVATVWTLALR
jgi:Ca2+-binding RTX toxin-like protein